MTKIQLRYPLIRPLDDSDLDNVANVRGVYGILQLRTTPSLDAVIVEYDASRLSEQDVESALYGFGIPIQRTLV